MTPAGLFIGPMVTTPYSFDNIGTGMIVTQRECDEAMNITTAAVIDKRGYDGNELWMVESDGHIAVTTEVIEKTGGSWTVQSC